MDQKKRKSSRNQHQPFEFCQVCKLNHNQGRQHMYFPNHKNSLRLLLSRFQREIYEVKFFVKNPMPLRAEHANINRLWCIFCDLDVLEHDSHFACGNAIKHLASEDHRMRITKFMGKHGGGLDDVDLFHVSDEDLKKWENKCKLLKTEAYKLESCGSLPGELNNIHNELCNAENMNCFHEINAIHCNFITASDVVPLQRYTNERGLMYCAESSSACDTGSSAPNSCENEQARGGRCVNIPTGVSENQYSLFSIERDRSTYDSCANGYVASDGMETNAENRSTGLLNPSQISWISRESTVGNVHTGAPPPWFYTTQRNHHDMTLNSELVNSKSYKPGKPSKLNPKRVGAAWAERRKLELELEKRGELPTSNFNASWLPNFGRVWQSGTRKESKREFQNENKMSHEENGRSENCMPLQPYISKRMRRE